MELERQSVRLRLVPNPVAADDQLRGKLDGDSQVNVGH
jgi:hypothetical protein